MDAALIRYNGLNQIGSGARGTNTYVAEAYNQYNGSNYATETDFDINTSHPHNNNGSAGAYDVQNTMTHEMGHLLGIYDSYASDATEWTMYGNGALGETKKRSLHAEDIVGINALY